MELPWWALSPSPFTIVIYLTLAFYGVKQLLERTEYKRWKYLMSFADSILILGLIVLIGDSFWIVASALRFGSTFPESVMQLVFAFGRNLAGIAFCILLVGAYFKNRVVRFNRYTIRLVLANCVFLCFWFMFASSPAYTDWTFAIRYNYPLTTILSSFLISHVIGKSLIAATYYTLWR